MIRIKKPPKYKQGWFKGVGPGEGSRTLAQQLTNLQDILALAPGASVLDIGCAEGCIAKVFAERGARRVDGLSIVQGEIDIGRALCRGLPVNLWQCDAGELDEWIARHPQRLLPRYDIVLLLSVVQKVPDMGRLVERAVALSSRWVAFRAAPVMVNWRQDYRPYRLWERMLREFDLAFEGPGAQAETVGIFRRRP